MDDLVKSLASDSGKLLSIGGTREHPGRYVDLEFVHENGSLRLSCDDDTDEVLVEVVTDPSLTTTDVSGDSIFEGALGKVIEYAWTMTNHRGYGDGFQLRFLDLGTREEVAWQVEVAASAMYVRRVVQ